MKFALLISAFLLPALSLAGKPSAFRADDGTDLSVLLKRYDGPIAILRRTAAHKRHIVPRTLQVEEVPVRRALNGLVKKQGCVDAGYVPCPGGAQCCPAGATCGPGTCCPAGGLPCAGNCCPSALGDCCNTAGCCPAGQKCFTALNGDIGCCPVGKVCTTVSGCAEVTSVECPGETFCCPVGDTCGRDANGAAICTPGGGNNNPNPNPTPTKTTTKPISTPTPKTTTANSNGNGNNNNNGDSDNNPNTIAAVPTTTSDPLSNLNPFKKSAAVSQAAGASGLMVAVALLGAFLL